MLKITNPHSNKHSYDALLHAKLTKKTPPEWEEQANGSWCIMSCSSGVTQEAQGRCWPRPRPLIPRRDVITFNDPVVSHCGERAREIQISWAANRGGPGAQPSFNSPPRSREQHSGSLDSCRGLLLSIVGIDWDFVVRVGWMEVCRPLPAHTLKGKGS